MKKNTVIILALVCSVLLGVLGMNMFFKKQETPKNESSTTQPAKERVEIKEHWNSDYQSIVIVQEPDIQKNYGTGFLVGENKLLTNKHVGDVFKDNKNSFVRLKNENGEFIDFKIKTVIEAPYETADLALIEVFPTEDGRNIHDNIKMLELASQEEINNVKIGDAVHTVGYPGDKDYGSLWNSEGNVLSMGGNFITYNAFISGGNSGSPLFNKDGKIIGLSNAGNGEPENGNAISYGFLLTENLYEFVQTNIK